MMRKNLTAALLVLPLLAACESYSPSKQDVGMAAGAVVGGVLGHQIGHGSGQTVATVGGAALGAFFGSRVGRKMDRSDQLEKAARAGDVDEWPGKVLAQPGLRADLLGDADANLRGCLRSVPRVHDSHGIR